MGRYANKAKAQKEKLAAERAETDPKGSLSNKQIVFVQEYVKSLNATQAAKLAGYSEKSAKTQASRLLSNELIQEEINKYMADRAKNTEITIESVLAELATIGFAKRAVKDADKIKALELIGRNLGMWDGTTGGKDKKDRDSALGWILGAVEKHSKRGEAS